jgi:chromosome segregation ATPase
MLTPYLRDRSGDADSLRNTITSLNKDKSDLTARISSLESTISSLQTDAGLLKEARVENQRLEEESREQRSVIDAQSAQLIDLQKLQAELDSVKLDLETTSQKAKTGDEDVERLMEDVKKLTKEMKAKEAAVKSQTEDLENRLNRQRDREGGLEAEVARLKQVSVTHWRRQVSTCN